MDGDAVEVQILLVRLHHHEAQENRQYVVATASRLFRDKGTAVSITGDDDGMAQLCTMVGTLVLARATRDDPISEELLQAARTALTTSDSERTAPQHRTD